jgi:hypothetical protein
MLDELKDACETLVSDLPRFAAIFLITGIALGVLIASAFTPSVLNYTGHGTQFAVSCTGVKPSYILPYLTNIGNEAIGVGAMQCAITNGQYLSIGLWYAELTAAMVVVLLVLIMLHVGGAG